MISSTCLFSTESPRISLPPCIQGKVKARAALGLGQISRRPNQAWLICRPHPIML
jgi:hypothetical protein